jgi:hypothetical protein
MHPKRERPPLSTPSLRTPTELCRRLEDRGIATWSQGEGLLDDLQAGSLDGSSPGDANSRTRSLLCHAAVEDLLRVLPRAVVTASEARRLTIATTTGPIDLFALGAQRLEDVLLDFGLSPLAFAFRPVREEWCDPSDARKKLAQGLLDLARATPNAFEVAPRRYWITARLLSQYQLEPSPELLESARSALPGLLDRLPCAAPARRQITRILFSPDPGRGLAFLRNSGVGAALFPGMKRSGEAKIAKLGPDPALRWAAWLDGTAIQRAMVKLRMPHALARSIERLHRAHPIDRTIESLREGGSRKILQRLRHDEIDGLVRWRRLDLAAAAQTEETRLRSTRLEDVESQLAKLRLDQERSRRVRALALDGKTVMHELEAGPGPHVGHALAHLARFVERNPEANDPDRLMAELRVWTKGHAAKKIG